MTPAQAITTLRQFNEWRRGDEDIPQFDPHKLGEAIDAAVEMIKRLNRVSLAIEIVWYRNGLDIRGASLSNFLSDLQTELDELK